jgi:hypothetical protein
MAASPPPIDLCSHVRLKNNLLIDHRYSTIKKAIITRITSDLPDYMNYKFDAETTLFICTLVENMVLPSDVVDKQALVCDIYIEVFGMNEMEIMVLKSNINFLHNHKRIKKVSKYFFWITSMYQMCVGK